MITQDKCIDTCNKLLRGERSAVEAYDQAIKKFGSGTHLGTLTNIRQNHVNSVLDLERNIMGMDGTPDVSSGVWGTVTSAIQATANLFGKGSAVESLIKGEEIGQHDYTDALETGEELFPECRVLIQSVLLSRVQHHLTLLKSIEESVD